MDELLKIIALRLSHLDEDTFTRDHVEEALHLSLDDAEEAYIL